MKKLFFTIVPFIIIFFNINLFAIEPYFKGYMYVANEINSSVYKIDGYGNYSILLENIKGASGIAVDSNKTLYISDDTNHISALTLDGNLSVLDISPDILSNPNALAIDGDYLFIANAGDSIARVNLRNLSDSQVLVRGLNIPQSVLIKDNFLYFTDDNHALYRVDKNSTSTVTDLNSIKVIDLNLYMGHTDGGLAYSFNYDTNQSYFYISDYQNSKIIRVNETNLSVDTIFNIPNSQPRGLFVYGKKLFASLFGLHKIVMVDLDTNATTIISDFSDTGYDKGPFGLLVSLNNYNYATENNSSSIYSYSNGWSLLGAIQDTLTDNINCYNGTKGFLWKYDNNDKKWLLKNYRDQNNYNYETFDTVYQGEGFWIKCE